MGEVNKSEKAEIRSVMNQLPKPFIDNMGKGITSTAQARELGKKGGSVSSTKKSVAAYIRELKKKGSLNEESAQKIYDMVVSRELSITDSRRLVEASQNLAAKALKSTKIEDVLLMKEQAIILKRAADINDAWIKTTHGQKVTIDGEIHNTVVGNVIVEMWLPDGRFENKNKLQPVVEATVISPKQ